jgi:hypothetical protein
VGSERLYGLGQSRSGKGSAQPLNEVGLQKLTQDFKIQRWFSKLNVGFSIPALESTNRRWNSKSSIGFRKPTQNFENQRKNPKTNPGFQNLVLVFRI